MTTENAITETQPPVGHTPPSGDHPDLDIITEIDISHLQTEDDSSADSIFSERQQRLLVDTLYADWATDMPFGALSNVGLFYGLHRPPVVPAEKLAKQSDERAKQAEGRAKKFAQKLRDLGINPDEG